jgi:pimeloyl-ACP methyl ester carboxylesterase
MAYALGIKDDCYRTCIKMINRKRAIDPVMAFLELSKNQRLYYRLIPGSADRPCLVFLHEGLGCVAMWKNYPDKLCRATGCPGLVYDRNGFGQSSPQNPARTVHYLHYNGLVELVEVIERLIPGRSFILVGQSDGASIALIHAAERPEQLKGVIAEAPHVMVEPVTIEGIRNTVRSYDNRMRKALVRYHGEKAEDLFNAWHGIWLSDQFRHWNITYLLPSILCPCLILHGKNDPYGSEQHAQLIASKLSGPFRLELIEDCGHAPHHEATEYVLGLMGGFADDPRYACVGAGNRDR